MKTATGLTVIAIGAILAFAITTSPGFVNLHVVGWILMATGGVGILLTPRSQDWLRRRIVVRRVPAAPPRTRTAPELASGVVHGPAHRDGYGAPSGSAQQGRPESKPGGIDDQGATRPIQRPAASGTEDQTIEEYVER